MNKIFVLLLCLAIVAGCSTVKEKSWSDGQDDTIMWSVSDGDSEIFLLGSVHVGDDSMYPLDSEIYSAYDESEGVVVEINVDNVDPMSAMKYMMFQDERTLKSQLSDTMYKKVVQKLSMIPEIGLAKMKPWAVGLTMMEMESSNMGLTGEYGIDKHFLEKARGDNKVIAELETVEYQFELFDGLFEGGDEVINYFLQEGDMNTEDVLAEILDNWKAGNVEGINKLVNDGFGSEDTEELREAFLTKRNIEMTDKIEGYLKDNKKYFVIAGAAHMIGEGGIVDLLNKSGKYKVIRF